MKILSRVVLFLSLVGGLTNIVESQEKDDQARKTELQDKVQEIQNAQVESMPTEEPWYLDQNFWYSFRFQMSESLHDADIHFRKGELNAAATQIQNATNWLRIAKESANDESKTELQTVIESLDEIAKELVESESVSLEKLNKTIAKANLAIARHHFSKANLLIEDKEVFLAARRLVAASDHLKNAAHAANAAPIGVVGVFEGTYNPSGMVDQTLVLTPEQVEGDLQKLGGAIKELSEQLTKKSEQKER